MLDFFLKCCLRGICSTQSEASKTSLDSRWATREEISVLKFSSQLVRCVCNALTHIRLFCLCERCLVQENIRYFSRELGSGLMVFRLINEPLCWCPRGRKCRDIISFPSERFECTLAKNFCCPQIYWRVEFMYSGGKGTRNYSV